MPSSSNRKRGRDLAGLLFSLLLAFSIWLIHNLSLNYTQVIAVPVTARSNIEGHQELSSNSCEVAARCRMNGFALLRHRNRSHTETYTVFFDAADLRPDGGDLFSVVSEQLVNYFSEIFGDGAILESMVSRSVQFRFPYENHRKVPVVPVQSLSFRPQYMALSPMVVQPDSVTIYGEPYQVDAVDAVFTRTIELNNVRSGVHGIVPIIPVNGIRMSATEVSYSMSVTRYVEVTASLPVSVRGVPAGKTLSVYPSQAEVTFRCAFPVLESPEEKTRLYIDYDDFASSINGRCVARPAGLPMGVIDCRIEPQVFECVERGRH